MPEPLNDDQSFEVVLVGTPEMATAMLRLWAEEYRFLEGGIRFRVSAHNHGEIGPGLNLRIGDGGPIGWIFLLELPGQRTLLRVPPGRGSADPSQSWGRDDKDGAHFARFMGHAMEKFAEYGFTSRRARFKSDEMLRNANRALDAADTPDGFAAVGMNCRQALIALANELYNPSMLHDNEEAPKGDDARSKLRIVAPEHEVYAEYRRVKLEMPEGGVLDWLAEVEARQIRYD